MEPTNSGAAPHRSESRDSITARAAAACARASDLIANCVRLQDESRQRQLDREALAAAIAETRNALASSVADYSRGLRDVGTPPEQAVVLLKTLLSDVCPSANFDDVRVLRADIIKWCVDAYFAA